MDKARHTDEAKQSAQGDLGRAGTAVKDGVTRSLKGLNEIEGGIVSLVRNIVADTLRLAADVTGMTITLSAEVMKGAIKATEEIGTGLTLSAKSVTKGVVMGVGDVGGDVVAAASRAVKGAITGAAGVGGDVAVVARRAVEGAIEAGKEVGANVEEIARVTVGGAVDAATSIGTTASRTVKEILIGVTEGAREIAGATFPAGSAKESSSHEAILPRKTRGSLKAHPHALKAKRLEARPTSKTGRTRSPEKGVPRVLKSPLHRSKVTNIDIAAKKMTVKGNKGDMAFDVSTAAIKAGDTVTVKDMEKDGKMMTSSVTMGKAQKTKISATKTKKETGK